MLPLVSIIMPAYNAGRYIEESIRSVLDQTYSRWELIVVDDGSKDETADVARGFAAAGRIRYLFQRNGGPGSARNMGLANARGDLVAFLDADDLWLRQKLELQVAAMSETGADLVFSDGYIFSDDGQLRESDKFAIVPGKTTGAEMFRLLFDYNRIATLSVLARRSALDDVGYFVEDLRICEDYDLWLRLAKSGAVFFGMEEKLMKYRRHPGSTTHYASKLLESLLTVVMKHAQDDLLEDVVVRRRIRGLYRELISALAEEGKIAEARERMREFSDWDKGSIITILQSVLLQLLPSHYNFISRECLYRTEWHAAGITRKFKGA